MSVWLITGGDTALVSMAASKLIGKLVGCHDRSLMLTQLREEDLHHPEGGYSLSALVDAAQTPPLLTDRRVVVGHHLARFSRASDYADLLSLLANVLPTTDLVLVWERGQTPAMEGRMPPVPKKLAGAIRSAGGEIINTDPPAKKSGNYAWVKSRIAESNLRFEPAAVNALVELVGEDHSLVVGCLLTLEGVLGSGGTVTANDVVVYGGEPGSVAPWDLDDAIDSGDIKTAIEVLHRQLSSRHPLQIVAILHTRYQRMLRLDGVGVVNEREAAKMLGMKGSSFPAKKLIVQVSRLGSQKIARGIRLLAQADLSLRGAIEWPEELVMEVLVARLAAMTSRSR